MNKDRFQLVPAKHRDIEWISQLESSVYTKTDAVPFETLEMWYNSNPDGFFLILFKGRKVGHIDILPLKPDAVKNLLSGRITEHELKSSDIYTPLEKDKITDLYIESLAIDLPQDLLRAKALISILSNFMEIAEKISDPSQLEDLYAIAASDEGSSILKHLGFKIAGSKTDRKDKHDLFSVNYPKLIDRLKTL